MTLDEVDAADKRDRMREKGALYAGPRYTVPIPDDWKEGEDVKVIMRVTKVDKAASTITVELKREP